MAEYQPIFINNDKYKKESFPDYTFKKMNEASLSRVWQHGKNGFIIASAFRHEYDYSQNLKRHEQFKKMVRGQNLGFWVVDGHWIEDYGKPTQADTDELSLFIPYRDTMTPEEFTEFSKKIRSNFGQDAVLIQKADGSGMYLIYSGGEDKLGGKFSPDKISQAYTRFRKGKHKGRTFVFEGIQNPSGMASAMLLKQQGIIF